MGEFAYNAPFTEPTEIACVYVSGAAIEVSRHTVQVIAWTDIPKLGGGEPDERRIILRFVMPIDAGAKLGDDLNGNLPRLS